MTPDDRQAATLAALDRLIKAEESATSAPWRGSGMNTTIDAERGFRGKVVCSVGAYNGGWPSAADSGLIVALRNDAARSLRGRRSILVRHGPISISWEEIENWEASSRGVEPAHVVIRSAVVCERCSDVEEDANGKPTHGDGGFTLWEDCPDWRDAAAGLEVPDA